jgi:amino acid permease
LVAEVQVSIIVLISRKLELLINSRKAASPFVIALNDAGIRGLDRKSLKVSLYIPLSQTLYQDFLNVVICISVISVGISCVYAGSRTLTALAETGYAPKVFTFGISFRRWDIYAASNLVSIQLTSPAGRFTPSLPS